MHNQAGCVVPPATGRVSGKQRPVVQPIFSDAELKAVRGETANGLHQLVPSRCYWDEEVYRFEVEHILKKNWLAVGRWDWAEKPGDYFTLNQFGEPLVIVRDRKGELHCLINVCRHRWSQVVQDGTGNLSLLVCPYHHWTYNLDGTLRGVSVKNIAELNREDCAMRKLRLEVWQGIIFINFDLDAKPLAPQLQGLLPYLEQYGLGEWRTVSQYEYETSWNYKFSFETGYEAYHHAGLHSSIEPIEPSYLHEQIALGEIWGLYGGKFGPEYDKPEITFPFGRPPWMSPEQYEKKGQFISIFVGIYPGLIWYISPSQMILITTQHVSVDRNVANTHISLPQWALDRKEFAHNVQGVIDEMKRVQLEDTFGCTMLQKGARSEYNDHSVIHPRLEPQLIAYHKWLMDQYLNAAKR